MLIGGFQKFSLIDFPQKTAALIFTQGCPFLCHFCHNPTLVLNEMFSTPINEDEILSFLKKRQNQLDAVVITGGEPTVQKDLIEFIKKIKNLNYLVKLDTNGINPDVIKLLLDQKLLDYIAMDIKAPLEKYNLITQTNINFDVIKKSIDLIIFSNINYEFRTTLIKNLHELDDIEKMSFLIKGSNLYILQKFVSKITLNPDLKNYTSFSEDDMLLMKNISQKYVNKCIIR
jgi:pyruvate formate lyase activating enzyme